MPGSHLPHVWVGDAASKVSTLDLAPYGAFTLFTGIAGEAWAEAAEKVGRDLNVPIKTVDHRPRPRGHRHLLRLGPGSARSTRTAPLLVRPDKFIGWRSMSLPAAPRAGPPRRPDRPASR